MDRSSDIPLYRQLAEFIRSRIAAGTYAAGSVLPSERTLMVEHELSRVAVRLAIDVLAREGLVMRRRGKGTYVAKPRMSHDLMGSPALTGLYDALVRQDRKTRSELLTYRIARPTQSDGALMPYETVVFAERVFHAGGEPIVVLRSDLHPKAKSVSEEVASATLNYEIMTDILGFTIERAHVSIRAELPQRKIAELLRIGEMEPVLVMRRSTFAAGNIAIERTTSFIRSDRYEFALSVQEGRPPDHAVRAQTPAAAVRRKRASRCNPR